MIIPITRLSVPLLAGLFAVSSHAEPWIAPGDLVMRHDLQLLADAGVISAPINTWPISWADVSRQLEDAVQELNPAEAAALRRVNRWREIHERGGLQGFFRAGAGANPRQLRTFENTPRETGEVQGGVDWLGERMAVKLTATYAAGADDGQNWRPDGSYVAFTAANWSFSFGYEDKWWGPGQDASLILSSNARPVPALRFQRLASNPPPWRGFRWVGPWTFSAFFGRLESDRHIPHAKFLGMRFGFRPIPGLEIAASRSAQWGGEGRPETLSNFIDLLLGNDNRGGDITEENEPGNQLGGFDIRYSAKGLGVPLAVYSQFIGEDEAGGLPSRYLGQVGIEFFGGWGDLGSYRVHLEYANTACDFLSEDLFNCAYNNSIYLDGYRYRGRVIGHSADNDSEIVSLGGFLVDQSGHQWNLLLRHGDLNRGGPPDPRNSLTRDQQGYTGIQFTHIRELGFGRLEFGAGLVRFEDEITGDSSNDAQAFIQLRTDL